MGRSTANGGNALSFKVSFRIWFYVYDLRLNVFDDEEDSNVESLGKFVWFVVVTHFKIYSTSKVLF